MASKNPYDILGVSKSASQDEIKRAYRRLAKEHHPDRNPGNKAAEQKFKEVQAAYDVIGDPERREQFDRFGEGGPRPDFHHWQGQPHRGSEDFNVTFGDIGDLSSIFEQFFRRAGGPGRGNGSRGRSATVDMRDTGSDLVHEVELSFDEAAQGTTREVVLSGGGRSEHIRVKIPAGVGEGQRIRVPGKGHPGHAGRGDLILVCHVRSHPYFRREGLDLYLEVPISISEAILGASIDIPTLTDRVTIRVPPGTSGNTKLRVREQGIRDVRSNKVGDLYAVIRVRVPQAISETAQKLAEELQREQRTNPRATEPWFEG